MIFKQADDGVTFAIKVVPRSSKNRIEAIPGDALKVRLTAPPVEGKANAALVKFLAEELGIRRSQIEIVGGEKSKQKIVRVSGMTAAQIQDRIAR